MKVLGITGGVGTGKSTVLRYIRETYGARTIQADQVSHMLQEPGKSCYIQIVELFGSGILNSDRTISKQKLAGLVFARPEQLSKLNAVMHPAVKAYIIAEIAKEKEAKRLPFLVIEAALLIEDHYDQICDVLWYIYADYEVRISRLMKSRGYSREKSVQIMGNQLSDAGFRAGCQLVVDNSGDFIENTCIQIDRGLKKYEFL